MSKTNESLLKRRQAAVPRGVGQIHPVVAERAENSTVWDVEGREYIDFAGGIAVLNTGHLHPKVIAAVQEQLGKLSHTCFQVLAYEPYIEPGRGNRQARAGRLPEEDPAGHLRLRSRGERRQDRPRRHRSRWRDRLHWRLPRPHHDDPGPDRQGGPVLRRHGPDAGRHLPRPGALRACTA